MGEDEGLILRAQEAFKDTDADKDRAPGDKWMIRGPKEYVPPVEVEVVSQRKAIPLDENEGIYIRDTKSGKVKSSLQISLTLWKQYLSQVKLYYTLGSKPEWVGQSAFNNKNSQQPITRITCFSKLMSRRLKTGWLIMTYFVSKLFCKTYYTNEVQITSRVISRVVNDYIVGKAN